MLLVGSSNVDDSSHCRAVEVTFYDRSMRPANNNINQTDGTIASISQH